MKTSIIIPARGEKLENINRTLENVFRNMTGEFEVLVGLDGFPGYSMTELYGIVSNKFKYMCFPSTVGIKTNINALASMATGKYLFKLDAHTRVSKGIDERLKENMQPDWIVMPRFKIIKEDWTLQTRGGIEEFYDYFYLCCPFTDKRGFRFKAGGHWREKTVQNLHTLIDETPQIHGSGWFMERDRYFELGGFPNIDPHGHAQEPIWLALKNWLTGGKVMVNKNCWYAHLHQQGNKRGYSMDTQQQEKSYRIAAEHFVGDKGNYLHNFEWFVDKFMPMPSWPENWKEILHDYQQNT